VVAFAFKRVGGTAVFLGMLAGEAAIFWAFLHSHISYLWYNVIGCVVVVTVALALTWAAPGAFGRPASPPER
jgi:hypothetical protein